MNDEARPSAADEAGPDVLLSTLTPKATAQRWGGGGLFAFFGLATLVGLLAPWILPEQWTDAARSGRAPAHWIIGLSLAAVCFAASIYLFRFAIPLGMWRLNEAGVEFAGVRREHQRLAWIDIDAIRWSDSGLLLRGQGTKIRVITEYSDPEAARQANQLLHERLGSVFDLRRPRLEDVKHPRLVKGLFLVAGVLVVVGATALILLPSILAPQQMRALDWVYDWWFVGVVLAAWAPFGIVMATFFRQKARWRTRQTRQLDRCED